MGWPGRRCTSGCAGMPPMVGWRIWSIGRRRPGSCPHQMPAAIEVRVIALRWEHRGWGPARILHQLAEEQVTPLPGRSSVYRALVRNGLIDPAKRRRKRSDYRRWERGRSMELWQMDVMGGVHLADGSEVKVVTGIDDHSRFVVCASVVARATARPVCEALQRALSRHGVPEQILTDNGKVFTGAVRPRAGAGACSTGSAPRTGSGTCSPRRIRRPPPARWSGCTRRCGRSSSACTTASSCTVAELQAALDGWVVHYNTERPHQSVGMRPPADRFRLAATRTAVVADRRRTLADPPPRRRAGDAPRPPGVSAVGRPAPARCRWPGSAIGSGAVFAGELVEVVVSGGLVEILHAGVLVATHVQRHRPDKAHRPPPADPAAHPPTRRASRWWCGWPTATARSRFAGAMYRAGRAWARRSIEVSLIAGSVQLAATARSSASTPPATTQPKNTGLLKVWLSLVVSVFRLRERPRRWSQTRSG